jgi:tetratricopeptide (TPR) repeat protein
LEGALRLAREDLPGATAAFEHAVTHLKRTMGPSSVELISALSNVGRSYSDTERLVEAEATYEEALALAEKVFPPEHPGIIELLLSAGDVAIDSKKTAEAIAYAERGYALLAKNPQPMLLHRAHYLLGQALWLQGKDKAHAQKLIAEARTYFSAAGPAYVNTVEVIDDWKKQHGVP